MAQTSFLQSSSTDLMRIIMYHEKIEALFPKIFLQARHAIPNIMIRMHEAPGSFLDRRFFLPLAVAARYFWTRQVALLGDDPLSHPHINDALNLWKESAEHLAIWIRPGQLKNHAQVLKSCANEIVYLLGPYDASSEQWDNDAIMLKKEIAQLKKDSPRLTVRAQIYFSALALSILPKIAQCAQEAQLEKLEFFPPPLHDSKNNNNSKLNTLLLTDEQIKKFEENFWEIMDEKYFQSCLFDLDMTRRQLERIINFFKAANGSGNFEPPHCRAPRTALFIEPNGDVRCCPYQTVCGSLWVYPLRSIEESSTTHEFRTKINLYTEKKCLTCPGNYPHLLWRA